MELAPGESKKVTFTLDKRSFAYYNVDIHDFFVESGDYTIMVGASSSDIRRAATVHVEGTVELPRNFTLFTPIADILESSSGKKYVKPIIDKIMKEHREAEGNPDALGAGADKMFENMILEMPILSLASFGIFTIKEVQELLDKIN